MKTLCTAISTKVVLEKKEEVEYERESLVEYITIHRFSTKFEIKSCFLMNINHDQEPLETKFCSICEFLIVTPTIFSHSYSTFSFGFGTTSNQLYAFCSCHVYRNNRMETGEVVKHFGICYKLKTNSSPAKTNV